MKVIKIKITKKKIKIKTTDSNGVEEFTCVGLNGKGMNNSLDYAMTLANIMLTRSNKETPPVELESTTKLGVIDSQGY